MKKKYACFVILFLVISLLTGCNMRTVDQMYSPPRRPEAHTNLQTQIDLVMNGLEYSAPLSGENRQAVQSVDLNGDGVAEYLLFTKSASDKPLKIHIFAFEDEQYSLIDTIESTGSAFDLVEFQQMDDHDGVELIVGRQLSNQVLRSVSVYTLRDGQIEQMMSANYSKLVCVDLDSDRLRELLVLRPGENESDRGIAELYGVEDGIMERSQEVNMSEPTSSIKRIMVNKLLDGLDAVYVASDVGGSAIITDVYAVVNGVFTNVSFSSEFGTSVQTLRNYYVYADDIDRDGVLELPNLINMHLPEDSQKEQGQHLIQWYSLSSDGSATQKHYTYHNYVGGWYMKLRTELAQQVYVEQKGNGYTFNLWDAEFQTLQPLATVYVLTGQMREQQAVSNNRFVLHRTESTVYAADLDVFAATYEISKDEVINSFQLIQQDWNTGET